MTWATIDPINYGISRWEKSSIMFSKSLLARNNLKFKYTLKTIFECLGGSGIHEPKPVGPEPIQSDRSPHLVVRGSLEEMVFKKIRALTFAAIFAWKILFASTCYIIIEFVALNNCWTLKWKLYREIQMFCQVIQDRLPWHKLIVSMSSIPRRDKAKSISFFWNFMYHFLTH